MSSRAQHYRNAENNLDEAVDTYITYAEGGGLDAWRASKHFMAAALVHAQLANTPFLYVRETPEEKADQAAMVAGTATVVNS